MKVDAVHERRSTTTRGLRLIDRAIRKLVLNRVAGLTADSICLMDPDGRNAFGDDTDARAISIRVHDERFYRRLALGGSLGAAESYMEGEWECDDLVRLMRLLVRNHSAASRLDCGWAWIKQLLERAGHWRRVNTRRGSRRNIGAHYDLGNDFFRLWLDATLAYSCGIFPDREASLYDASTEKFDRVCRKLELKANDHLLEIGTGWGGFALHAARRYGCRVTTTTISREQYKFACQRVAESGLAERITVLDRDYRDLSGQFDKLVSIEMIEAVGPQFLDTFFGRCGELLKPDGSMVLQGIVMPERGYSQYLASVDFIRKHVFPGGSLPSLATLLESAGRASRLRCVQLEDFASHYAETLRRWRTAFEVRLPEIRQLGYSERLLRMWRYYLCYCEAGFAERRIGVVQMTFDNDARRSELLPLARASCRPADSDTCPASTQHREMVRSNL